MKIDPDALHDMILWARSRIDHCRREEQKFGHAVGRPGRISTRSMPQALIEAWTERRSLQAVLKQLGREYPAGDTAVREMEGKK